MTKAAQSGLQFKKSIISSADKPIPQKELLERLDALSTELSKVEQDNFNVKSLDKIKDDLVNKKLINHKDNGVQSLVACCLADCLRIYAPDAPYTDAELSDIFKLFVKQFKRLADPENGYYSQQVYLITRLAEVRSIILVTDIDNGSSLIESIFDLFYDQSNVFHKRLEPIISDILIEIISEWDQITTPVLKLILNKFITGSRSAHGVTSALPTSAAQAFNFSVNICNANPDRLARQLAKFFSEVLCENTAEGGEPDFKNLSKLHTLLTEVWKHVPEILGSVMGLLDDELNADSDKFRGLATETVGKVLASQSRVNFVTVHRDTWLSWMKKTLDIAPQVRVKWVEQAAEVLVSRSDVLPEITNGLSKTLIDTDEHVRLATVRAISTIPADVLLRKVHNTSILTGLVQLAREKHMEIREEAISILGSLFKDAYDDVFADASEGENEMYKIVKEIPTHLLNLYYINDKDINYLVDLTLLDDILPEEADDTKRVERMLNVVGVLDAKALSSFIAFNKRQQQLSVVISKLIEFCEEMNGDITSECLTKAKFDKAVAWLSTALPDHISPRESFHKFASLNNRRMYALIKWCISGDSDYAAVVNARKELFKRLHDTKSFSSGTLKDIESTFKIIIYRSSLTIFNRSNIGPLMKLSETKKYIKASQKLVAYISAIAPFAFKNQIKDLIVAVKEEKSSLKVNTLEALFHIFRKMRTYVPNNDNDFMEALVELAKNGTPSEAQFALKVLSLTKKIDLFGTLIFENNYPFDLESDKLATHLSAIAELFLVRPDIPEERAEEMTPTLVKDILLSNRKHAKKTDPEWVDDDTLESGEEVELGAKLAALRIFTSRLQSLDRTAHSGQDESVKTTAENVLKLLLSLIAKGGEILNSKSKHYPTPRHYQARLRLEAGLCILKLAQYQRYNHLLKPVVLDRVILLIQDENENIRSIFIRTMTALIKNAEISHKFIPSVYFMAYEPIDELKSEVKTWIRSTIAKRMSLQTDASNDVVFEKTLTGLIRSISHHAEFKEFIETAEEAEDESTKEESLLKAYTFALEYIAFFLENVAAERNISLIYYFATRVKQYRDATLPETAYFGEPEDYVHNLYRISDLAQLAIRDLAEVRGWTIQTYPGKLYLSAELFAKIPSNEEAHKVAETSYIPELILKRLASIVKQKINSIASVKRIRSADSAAQRKKAKVQVKKEKKYRKATVSDEEGEEEGYEEKPGAEPTRKSSRAKRISYTAQVKAYEEGEGEGEDGDDDDEDEE